MANGSYIGKISALVTASTSDLSRKLRGAAQDVDKFGNSVRAQFDRASRNAENSLNQIFTPLQRLQRALTAGRSATLNILKPEDVRRLQQSVSLAEQINKPLASAARAFQNLSADAAGAFAPALVRAQEAAVQLSNTLAETGQVGTTQFNQAQRAVEQTTEALQRLNEAQRLARSGPTGRELAFVAPGVSDTLRASSAIRQRAATLPAGDRSAVAGQVQNLSRVEQRIVAIRAAIERETIRPRVDATRLNELQDQLARYTAAAGRIRDSIQIRVDAADAETRLKEINVQLDRLRSDQAFRLTGNFQDIEQAKQALVEVLALQEQLTPSQRAANAPAVNAAIDAVGSGDLSASQDAVNSLRQSTGDQIKVNAQTEEAQAKVDALDASVRRLREQAAFVITGDAQNLDQIQNELSSVLTSIEKLDPSGRGSLDVRVQAVIDAIGREDLDGAREALRQLKSESGDAINIRVEADAAQDRIDQLSKTWTRALSGIPESTQEIDQEFQALASRISRLDIEDRVRLDGLVSDFQASVKAGDPLIQQFQKLLALSNALDKVDGRGLKKTGDIARGAFANSSLAIQQATFALDDFFSVTGGLDQRIRAAGNNLSQLGFILGSTEGLIVGVAISITAQLLIAFQRWATDADVAEEATKALNESLGRQKSAVDSLAQAYKSLADEIAKAGATERGRREIEIRQRVEEIEQRGRDANREDVAAFSPDVARLRGERGLLEQRLQRENDLGERLRLQAQIDANRRREQAAIERGIPRPTRAAVGADLEAADQAAVRQAEIRLRRARLRARLGGATPAGEDIRTLEANLRERQATLDETRRAGAGATGQQQLAQLRESRDRLEEERAAVIRARQRGESVNIQPIDDAIDDVTVSIRRLETALAPEVQRLSREFNRRALRLSEGISEIAERAAEVGANGIAAESGIISSALADLVNQLSQATSQEEAAAIIAQIDAIELQKRSLDSAIRSTQSFADALDRVSGQLLDSVAADARSAEDRARRERNRVFAEFRDRDDPAAQEARGRTARDFERARRQRQETEDRVAREQFLNRRLVRDFERQQQRGGGAGADLIGERDRAQSEIDRLSQERDEAINSGDFQAARFAASQIAQQEERRREAQRLLDRRFENSPQGQLAAAAADAEDIEARRGEVEQQRIVRGRELQVTPAEQAGRQLAEDIRSLQASFRDDPNQSIEDFRADRQRIIDEAFRSTAPAIFGLAGQVANAVLQGPSRAALTATDVSSVQGSAELNRLLRGDDPARNQDLVELQKQSRSLDELVRIARENGVPVAQ